MNSTIDIIKGFNEEEAKSYISLLFDGYINRKKENRLFEADTTIPRIIILAYYNCISKNFFNNVYDEFKNKYITTKNFKERYLYNENKLEDVHSREEQQGLRLVYDYIQNKNDFDSISIYTLSEIHEILFSKAPHPEFGGKYRTDERFLPNSGIDIVSPSLIVHEMNLLGKDIDLIIKEGINLGNKIDPTKIIDYIDKCIDIKCKLIKIHPFGDGNGRSIRAFINLLFKLAKIPPIYVENKEREKYGEAMQLALGEGDLSKIKQFYHYKICDSIISLDSSFNITNTESHKKTI